MNATRKLAQEARQASYQTAILSHEIKNDALQAIATALKKNEASILESNRQDLDKARNEGLAAPLLKRLKFDAAKIDGVVNGLEDLTAMQDPVGKTRQATRLDTGLDLFQVTCPIGVIGIIFESRPDALVQIAGLALKSGNALLLKGGSEASETNRCLHEIIVEASQDAGMPAGWIGLLETREDVTRILAMDEDIDLLIPRGSNDFVRYIMEHTKIPVLGHADGVCHVYLDEAADTDMAIALAVDSKTQYVAVCNAAETILVHTKAADRILAGLAAALKDHGVEIFGCDKVCDVLGCPPVKDWHTEYLDYKVSLKIVDDLNAAMAHINAYGSGHTDAIVTEDPEQARRFLQGVDSGNVFWNASTRFSDGFRYGFGAEVGISTSKIHARGPVGIDGLLTYQYRVLGHGQTVGEYEKEGKSFQHASLKKEYPLHK